MGFKISIPCHQVDCKSGKISLNVSHTEAGRELGLAYRLHLLTLPLNKIASKLKATRVLLKYHFSSVQFSHSVMSDSLQPHGLQHARFPCPLSTPGACSNSHPLRWRCHPTISSSVVPFSSCLQSFPASGSFPMRQFFASGGQSIRTSASASAWYKNYHLV